MLRVVEHFEKTHTGRQRKENEDSMFARPPVFVVADGMGGARDGGTASKLTVETFQAGLTDSGNAEDALAERVREANHRINELARKDETRAGMGTTVTAAYVGPDDVSVAHVGDSRAYRLRDGALERLTRDHSLVEELVRRGKLTEAEAEEHPQRSVITRALGPEATVEVDTRTHSARPGDVFLLCSDGLTSMVHEPRVAEILAGAESLQEAGHALIDQANENGGRDNITVLLFRVGDVEGAAPDVEQPTESGDRAPSSAAVAAAVKAADEESERAAASAPKRTAPLPSGHAGDEGASRKRRRRRPRGLGPAIAVLVVIGVLAIGGWIASRAVYFVGTDDRGLVTVYRGLPYDGPGGVDMYETFFTSGVPASDVPPARRKALLDHKLRSKDDASDLVRRIEMGQLETAAPAR